jgi:hypothetical protein
VEQQLAVCPTPQCTAWRAGIPAGRFVLRGAVSHGAVPEGGRQSKSREVPSGHGAGHCSLVPPTLPWHPHPRRHSLSRIAALELPGTCAQSSWMDSPKSAVALGFTEATLFPVGHHLYRKFLPCLLSPSSSLLAPQATHSANLQGPVLGPWVICAP